MKDLKRILEIIEEERGKWVWNLQAGFNADLVHNGKVRSVLRSFDSLKQRINEEAQVEKLAALASKGCIRCFGTKVVERLEPDGHGGANFTEGPCECQRDVSRGVTGLLETATEELG
jgi:hypothetical protein|tara:strand:+ start:581 stop:931 length:351 start_codon:yes stop_codon:yes gene_type:complete